MTSEPTIETMVSDGSEMRDWAAAWQTSRRHNHFLHSMLWDHVTHQAISPAVWSKRVHSAIKDYDLRLGRPAGIMSLRTTLATAINVRGSTASEQEAFAVGNWARPKTMAHLPSGGVPPTEEALLSSP